MRFSKGFLPTVKEVPADAVISSHQLMLRAGLMRPLGAGIYSFLPLGYAVMKKIMQIVREEMDAIGGQEFFLPALNPIELWEETGRVKAFGDTMFHIKNRPLVLAPTHEEVMTSIARNHIRSYKDLPQIWYQIQTKFRNEPRPKSGVLRGRQFLMKDSYSLDSSWEGLDVELRPSCRRVQKDLFALRFGLFHRWCIERSDGRERFAGVYGGIRCRRRYGSVCDQCRYAANVEVAKSGVANAAPVD